MEPQQIQSAAQLFADAMNQLAFISAIVGGFAIALLAGVLGRDNTRLTKWTVVTLSTSALLQISCTLFFSLTSFRILTHTANGQFEALDRLVDSVDPNFGPFVIAFFGSFLLFFAGIALTGWQFGKRTGWVATGVAAAAVVLAFYGLRVPF